MKYLTIGIFLPLLLLTACSKDSADDALIKHAELTKFEENLVDLTSEHSFIFDLEIKRAGNDKLDIIIKKDNQEKKLTIRDGATANIKL